MVCNYYIGFMVCIFAILYFFYCYFSKSKTEVNPYGEKLHFVRAGLRFAFFSILAAAISAFMLIAAYYSLQFGKTEFSSQNFSPAHTILSSLQDFHLFTADCLPCFYFPYIFFQRKLRQEKKLHLSPLSARLCFRLS